MTELLKGFFPGTVIWLLWALTVRPGWPETVLVFAPLVMVPLALFVVLGWSPPYLPADESDLRAALPRWARLSAAVAVALSFIPEQGLIASALTVPWLVLALATGVTGAARLLSRRSLDPMAATDFALMFLVVGAGWLTVSRAGANPLGFSDTIVQLTAVHFHYAGLALPIVAGVTSAQTNRSWLVAAAVVVGIPFTAAGITTGGVLEWVSATFMALSGLAVAAVLIRYSRQVATGWAKALTGVAAAMLTFGMILALG